MHPFWANIVDPMHTILLNVIRNVIHQCFYDSDKGGNATKIQFNKKLFIERLERYPWTAEQRRGRYPSTRNLSVQTLGYWKG